MGKVYLGNQEISPTVSVPVAKDKFGATIDTFIGNVDENGVLGKDVVSTSLVFDGVKEINNYACRYMFYGKEAIVDAVFPALTTIGTWGCYHMFAYCPNLTSVSFPALTTITGANACTNMVNNCSNLTNISLPALTEITGSSACSNVFASCPNLTSVSFPELTTITGWQACQSMFAYCSKLVSVSFPALTTVGADGFGNASYAYIFNSCNALTEIHFRADAQATIEAVTGYADKWGAKNATIYFSL